MAKRKSAKKPMKRTRKVTKKRAKRTAARRPTRTARPARKAAAPAMPAPRIGVITHTELASADPPATKAWCQKVLGWKFMEPMPTPTGPYDMWRFDNDTGGGLRANNPPETPGSIPYCEMADIRSAYSKALAAGATEMLPPMAIPGGMGWIAIVAAPGGVAIGFWAPK